MPDITICKSHECPSKEFCYRYKADSNPIWQSFGLMFNPDKECEYFMEIKKGE